MKKERYTVRGRDAYGNPVTETIEVIRLNWLKRLWRKLFRRPKRITGIQIKNTR